MTCAESYSESVEDVVGIGTEHFAYCPYPNPINRRDRSPVDDASPANWIAIGHDDYLRLILELASLRPTVASPTFPGSFSAARVRRLIGRWVPDVEAT